MPTLRAETSVTGVIKTLDEVPPPPTELTLLVNNAGVSFRFGGQRPSLRTGVKSTGGPEDDFDAETQFHLRYEFSSKCRWWWQSGKLHLRVTYDHLELFVDHELWMAHQPAEPFWESRLLLHELDHVRLSSDRRVFDSFRRRVRADDQLQWTAAEVLERLGPAIDETTPLQAEQLRKLVNEAVRRHFDQTVELIEIRYQELDRQTAHGGREVAAESELAGWLNR